VNVLTAPEVIDRLLGVNVPPPLESLNVTVSVVEAAGVSVYVIGLLMKPVVAPVSE
jgi:hypothetical protein